jgi:DinB superfamily
MWPPMLRLACDTLRVTTDEVADRIRTALERFERLRPAVEAGAPWPLAERFDDAPEASWGPPEVLAHLAEMIGFWTIELQRVAAGEGEPVPFGRTAADATRLAAIEYDRSKSPAELFARITGAADRFLAVWGAWTPAQRERLGLHPRLGELTVSYSADRFIASHLIDHANQLEVSLGMAPTPD